METIYIEETAKTPFIKFNAVEGRLAIKGKSITENAHKFYNPIINDWLEQYATKPHKQTTANIELEYFNLMVIFLQYLINILSNNENNCKF